jgi:hypothetical protein
LLQALAVKLMTRLLSPDQLAPSTMLLIIPPPQVLLRVFVGFSSRLKSAQLIIDPLSRCSRYRDGRMAKQGSCPCRDGAGLADCVSFHVVFAIVSAHDKHTLDS